MLLQQHNINHDHDNIDKGRICASREGGANSDKHGMMRGIKLNTTYRVIVSTKLANLITLLKFSCYICFN